MANVDEYGGIIPVVALTKEYCMYLDEWLCGVWLVDSDVLGPLPLNSQSSLPHLHWMLGLLNLSKLVNAQLKKVQSQQTVKYT